MSDTHEAMRFQSDLPEDPMLPGDPFIHLRFHYGLLLGAEDFNLEQRAFTLRSRIHQALLHGCGSVRGLRVGANQGGDMLTVGVGLAVDTLGRDIYVGQVQCLDVSGLGGAEVWNELPPIWMRDDAGAAPSPPGRVADPAGVVQIRRAYVVLRYEACMSHPVPAVAQPCADFSQGMAYSRLIDGFRIDLEKAPPADSRILPIDWPPPGAGPLTGDEDGSAASLRSGLLDRILAPADRIADLWNGSRDAPLVLASVDLALRAGTPGVVEVHMIDNSIRAILPPVSVLASAMLGETAAELPPGAPPPPRFRGWRLSADRTAISLAFTADIDMRTVAGGVRLMRLGDAGWEPLAATFPAPATPPTDTFDAVLPGALAAGDLIRISLSGETGAPLVGADARPLAGSVGEPLPPASTGRDVSVVTRI